MSETPVVQETTVTPEPPKEFVYEFQPTDEKGNPLGGKQVVKYDGTPEDLGRKMAENNSRLIALNRELNKKVRLSTSFRDEIPESAQRFDPSKYELKPEPLTAEEKIQLAQDMTDPEKMDAVADRLVRARIGDPEILRTRLARVEQRMDRSNVDAEARAFLRLRPDYYPLQANLETLAAWIEKNQLDPIKENFVLAYDTLKDVLEPRPAAPVSVQPPPPVAAVEPPPAPPAPVRPVSSGLTRSVASDSGPVANPGDEIVWGNFKGYEALERMPGDEYKRKLIHEKGFKEKVQALDNARAQKRQ
jgi:hypothetical protein